MLNKFIRCATSIFFFGSFVAIFQLLLWTWKIHLVNQMRDCGRTMQCARNLNCVHFGLLHMSMVAFNLAEQRLCFSWRSCNELDSTIIYFSSVFLRAFCFTLEYDYQYSSHFCLFALLFGIYWKSQWHE